MKQEIIRNQPCVRIFLIKLKRVVRAVRRGSGLRGKLRCLPSNTKRKAAATSKAKFYIKLYKRNLYGA